MSPTDWTRRKFLGRAGAGLAIGVGSVLVTSCTRTDENGGGGGGEAQDTLEVARDQGYIRVGFANEAPYGFAETDGTLTGQAPEVARAVFEALGVSELQGVLTEFGSLIPGLQANRFDVIAAGMFITPERCEQVIFSEPDYCGLSAFLVPTGNPNDISTYEDIANNPDLRLGVLTGAVEGDYATAAGVAEGQLSPFGDPPSMLEGLTAGRVDAISLTSISLRDLLERNPGADLEMTEPFTPVVDGEEQVGCGGYGFRDGDTALRDAFNTELAALQESGELLSIVEPFGFGEEEVSAAMEHTTEELCGG